MNIADKKYNKTIKIYKNTRNSKFERAQVEICLQNVFPQKGKNKIKDVNKLKLWDKGK